MQKTYPTLPGGWEIVEKLGSGSFGTVYRARRSVGSYTEWAAVKHIPIPRSEDELSAIYDELGSMDAGPVGQYLNEIKNSLVDEYQLLRTFSGHTNIVSCNDIQIMDRQDALGYDIYIWMELLTCVSSCILEGRMERAETTKLGIDICSALIRLEKRNVVHRDVKPQNIFVNEDGDYKLGDFGAARRFRGISTVLSRKGTDAYAAPEIIREQQGNCTADIYSLGLVLYRLMNNNLMPFMKQGMESSVKERELAILVRVSGEPLPPPVNADPELARIILKACAYKKEDRWQTAEEMRSALRRLRNGQPEKPVAIEPEGEKTEAQTPDSEQQPIEIQPSADENRPQRKKGSIRLWLWGLCW